MKPDVVIVGGGTTGCVLAARLSEAPERSVLLLEAGADYPGGVDELPATLRTEEVRYPGPDVAWFYDGTLGERLGRPTKIMRGKTIGGSGSINGSVFHRGVPEDYDDWGSPLWTYDAVLPYFKRYERDLDLDGPLHGKDGPVPIRRFGPDAWVPSQAAFFEAAVALGFPEKPDQMDPEGSGIGPLPRNSENDVRMSAALTHLYSARERPNLEVRGHTRATRVRFEGDRAVGVEVVDVAGNAEFIAAGEVILTAGTIATPHLLMLSGVGPAAHLQEHGIAVVADVPGVGKNLRDHPALPILLEGFDPEAEDARQHLVLTYTAAGSPARNDMNIFLGGMRAADEHGVDTQVLILLSMLEKAESAGEVRLMSADPLASPFVDLAYLESDLDRARMRESVHILARLADHEAFSDRGIARLAPPDDVFESDDSLDAWIDATIETLYHGCGTCRMGAADDPGAVVDDRGRVHGLAGLVIADLSIAPDVPRAATNATAFMIGERMADLYANVPVAS